MECPRGAACHKNVFSHSECVCVFRGRHQGSYLREVVEALLFVMGPSAEGHQMRSSKHSSRRQSGAALVEMAIALPLLILLFFGILEFGLAFRDRLTIANGTQSAGRVAAALGSQDGADMAVLLAVEQSLGLLPDSGGGVLKHVQIWKSDPSGVPVTACANAGNGGTNCNWYTYTPTGDPSVCDWTPCPDSALDPIPYGGGYIPKDRKVTLGELDVIGVTVLFSHDWITGVLPIADVVCTATGEDCWHDSAIFRLEPLNFGSGS